MSPDVDKFLKASKQWKEEITKLRSIIVKTKLEENFKWGYPCYTHNEKNVVIIQPFKTSLALMFFKGSLLKDPKGVLSDIGPNSQVGRRFEFTSMQEITKLAPVIMAYIKEAIKIEESGEKVKITKKPESVPDELKKVFSKNSKFKKAFSSLTHGRQRAYLMFFSGARQSSTRQSRIEKYMPHILEGRGMNDR